MKVLPMVEENTPILREIMNIAFGAAAGELEQLAGLSLNLAVPEIQPVQKENRDSVPDELIVEKSFSGGIIGKTRLVIIHGIDRVLIEQANQKSGGDEKTGREILLEIGQILANRTVEKIAEFMNLSVTIEDPVFSPVREITPDNSQMVYLKSTVSFRDYKMNGIMEIFFTYDSEEWLSRRLAYFMDAFR
jgi:chemotaxis protein CheY-P-specific phosphatase CheC